MNRYAAKSMVFKTVSSFDCLQELFILPGSEEFAFALHFASEDTPDYVDNSAPSSLEI